jgi:hypothetical protein
LVFGDFRRFDDLELGLDLQCLLYLLPDFGVLFLDLKGLTTWELNLLNERLNVIPLLIVLLLIIIAVLLIILRFNLIFYIVRNCYLTCLLLEIVHI